MPEPSQRRLEEFAVKMLRYDAPEAHGVGSMPPFPRDGLARTPGAEQQARPPHPQEDDALLSATVTVRRRPAQGLQGIAHDRQSAQPQVPQQVLSLWRASRSRQEAIEMLSRLLLNLTRSGDTPRDICVSTSSASESTWAGPLLHPGRASEQLERRPFVDASYSDSGPHDLGAHTGGAWGGDGWVDGPHAERSSEATTLMVRNIPESCTTEMLLEEWPIDGSWDFLYLPMTSGGRAALGYAFVNFTSPAHASAFAACWQGQRLSRFTTGRRLKVTVADVQGFDANVLELKRKPAGRLRARQCGPVIIKDCRRVELSDI